LPCCQAAAFASAWLVPGLADWISRAASSGLKYSAPGLTEHRPRDAALARAVGPGKHVDAGDVRAISPRLRAAATAARPSCLGDAANAAFIPARAFGVCIRASSASN
jgi:hypothetical protein